MNNNKYFFPVVLTIILIIIIIYLIMTVEQPYVECNKTYSFDENIQVKENVVARFNGNKIQSLDVEKTIIVPNASEEYLKSLEYSLKNTLDYLSNVKYKILDDRLVVTIKATDNETVILKNIEFVKGDEMQIKINTNTKSSEVITINVGDNYTEGEFMARFKNNSYVCK